MVYLLRLNVGIAVDRFRDVTGFGARTLFDEPIRRNAELGLISADETSIRLTAAGRLLANRVMADFL